MVVVLDGFHHWQFLLVNLAHEFPRSMTLVGNFLDLGVEKQSFGGFDCSFEQLPILEVS